MKRLIRWAILLLTPLAATAQQPRSPRTVAELPPNTIDCSNWRKTAAQQWIAHDPAKLFDFGTKLGWQVDMVESHDFCLSADGVTLYRALELKCGGWQPPN
jgi:hypothetical protein